MLKQKEYLSELQIMDVRIMVSTSDMLSLWSLKSVPRLLCWGSKGRNQLLIS